MLTNCRVVLVRPQVAGNVGATARAMRNFGLTDLVLVDPVADPADREARRLSTHGESILTSARVVPDLGDAVADCSVVAATSANTAGLFRGQNAGPADAILPRVAERLSQGPAALVFGPEPSGLTNAEIARCHFLVHVPADPAYPALNLSHAVAICLYELRKAWPGGSLSAAEPPAGFAEQERMFEHLREALTAVHFLYGPKAEPLMHAVRHLIGRAGPTPQEVKLLHGLARQLLWAAGRGGEPPSPVG
jgi:tRNA/rRNA methyltransferase